MNEVLSGASLRIYINGKVIGFATGFSFQRSQGIKKNYELDNPYPAEIQPTRYDVSGTLLGIRLRHIDGLSSSAALDINTAQAIFSQTYVTIEMVDRLTGVRIWSITGAMFNNESWSISNKGQVTFSASFIGTFMTSKESI